MERVAAETGWPWTAADDLFDRLSDAAVPEAFGLTLARRLPAIVGCDFASWLAADLDRGLLQSSVPEEVAPLVWPMLGYWDLDLPLAQGARRGLRVGGHLGPAVAVSAGAATWLVCGPGWAFGVAAHRCSADREHDRLVLDWLAPHVRACWQTAIRRSVRRARSGALEPGCGFALVSLDSGVLYMDDKATILLSGVGISGHDLSGRTLLRELMTGAAPDELQTVGDVTLRVAPSAGDESTRAVIVAPGVAPVVEPTACSRLHPRGVSGAALAPHLSNALPAGSGVVRSYEGTAT
jgi:hypothetical protein